ncbi:MAG: hypothetical protein M0Z46_00845 [Actinomycetota bacterium]|nr:hypothetical protein [Actinomycetota bacterium]
MVNAEGTIEAHSEEDRQFITRVHAMSSGHRAIQRELIEHYGDVGVRELVAELNAADSDPPVTATEPAP